MPKRKRAFAPPNMVTTITSMTRVFEEDEAMSPRRRRA
jgi:hypothetical protein